MVKRFTHLTLVAGAVAVTALAAGSSRAASSAGPACGPRQLSVRLIPGSPGAGQRYATLVLTNRSHANCHTYGYVGLGLLDGRWRALPSHIVRSPAVPRSRILLRPGGAAHALLHWSVVPGTGDPVSGCPVPARLEVTPPDFTSHLTLRWGGEPVCERGTIDVTALKFGR